MNFRAGGFASFSGTRNREVPTASRKKFMNTVSRRRLAGDWFDICSCNSPCPCEFAQAPTNDACTGMLAWHVREGQASGPPYEQLWERTQ